MENHRVPAFSVSRASILIPWINHAPADRMRVIGYKQNE